MTHAHSPSAWETEAGGSPRIGGQLDLQSETLSPKTNPNILTKGGREKNGEQEGVSEEPKEEDRVSGKQQHTCCPWGSQGRKTWSRMDHRVH